MKVVVKNHTDGQIFYKNPVGLKNGLKIFSRDTTWMARVRRGLCVVFVIKYTIIKLELA